MEFAVYGYCSLFCTLFCQVVALCQCGNVEMALLSFSEETVETSEVHEPVTFTFTFRGSAAVDAHDAGSRFQVLSLTR